MHIKKFKKYNKSPLFIFTTIIGKTIYLPSVYPQINAPEAFKNILIALK